MIVPIFAFAALAAMLASLWSSIGPHHPAFAFCVALAAFGFAIFMGGGIAKKVPDRTFAITDNQPELFRKAGVQLFDRALTAIGWNSLILKMRKPVNKTSDLTTLITELKSSATGHACALTVHATTALISLIGGAPITALWIAISAIPLHLYPLMLQLVNMHRVNKLRLLTNNASR